VIALLDYGAGNLASVRKALTAVGADFFTPSAADEVAGAGGIIIPGVGHFGATRGISASHRAAVLAAVGRGTPLLGICLGLQYLFDGSEEAPEVRGLGLLPGVCVRLPPTLKVPHVGWNTLSRIRPSALLADVADGTQVYFTHSYAAPVTEACVATTSHGMTFAAVVEHGRVYGVQFHPEKSSEPGIRVLRAFVDITRSGCGETGRCSHGA
jgi:glutamine amidotransferase